MKDLVQQAQQSATAIEHDVDGARSILLKKEIKAAINKAAGLSFAADAAEQIAETARESAKSAFETAATEMREVGWSIAYYDKDSDNGGMYSTVVTMLRKEIARQTHNPALAEKAEDRAELKRRLAIYLADDKDVKHMSDADKEIRRDIGQRMSRLTGYMYGMHRYLDLKDADRARFDVATTQWEQDATAAAGGDPKKLLDYAKAHPAPEWGKGEWDDSRQAVEFREAERVARAEGNMAACINIATHAAAIMTAVDAEWSDGERQLACSTEQLTRITNGLREIRAVVVDLMPNRKMQEPAFKKALDAMPGGKK